MNAGTYIGQRSRGWVRWLATASTAAVLTAVTVAAQAQWERTIADPLVANGATSCQALVVDGSGNVDVLINLAGATSAQNTFEVVQFNQAGVRQWAQLGPANCFGQSLAIRPQGDIFVSANSTSPFPGETLLAHLASNGAYLFLRAYLDSKMPFNASSNFSGNNLAVDSSGNVSIAMTGLFVAFLPQVTDVQVAEVLKVNQVGSPMWVGEYWGGTGTGATISAMGTDSSGDVLFEGTLQNSTEITGMFAAGNGSLVWLRQFKVPGQSFGDGRSITVDANSKLAYTVGSTTNGAETAVGTTLQKFDTNGDVLEQRVLANGSFTDSTYTQIAFGASDTIWIGGVSNLRPGVAQFDANDNFAWISQYAVPASFPQTTGVEQLVVTKSGNSIFKGSMTGTGTNATSYMFLIKVGPTGARLSANFLKAPPGFFLGASGGGGLASDISGHEDFATNEENMSGLQSTERGMVGQYP
ncbi:MAG: hypothetical protein KGJ62_15215 [Armatimonadetes bacterium]|nr:hypothetical protein [Armatimonadota bacterium]MDE2207521.1 hypothetical protein [Armatimonadota bacterium]